MMRRVVAQRGYECIHIRWPRRTICLVESIEHHGVRVGPKVADVNDQKNLVVDPLAVVAQVLSCSAVSL